MASILIVEDEEHLRTALGYSLRRAGYTVTNASSGAEALAIVQTAMPDLVLLDVMLPEIDGFEVLRRIRRFSPVPVLMLTARADEVDTVLGLELGADDYITKPFRVRELIARIGAALRRPMLGSSPGAIPAPTGALTVGDLWIDPVSHQATCGGRTLILKPRAFALLQFFMQHPGQVFSREQLLGQLWGEPFIGDPRTVDVHIRWIREQIEDDPSSPTRLRTIRNVGYQFVG
ncbi:response regulator transcription factor [Oscillochloris sp. ZM17-4]|uniref:response regulator transcription factor n=1 Tax=Oscillochloris sp. ZM17-4 TaxID=2866714 RepID=UPI001C72AA8E|nr:response regulator transcription factor [Oscillochloris sp. ZM17-4]MBX0327722.1 response regulator transcription factor [Oscillochloris sp. ZM17-4]